MAFDFEAPLKDLQPTATEAVPLPRVKKAREANAARIRADIERDLQMREVGGTPPTLPPIPTAIAERTRLEIAAVRAMHAEADRLERECETLRQEGADADERHQRERAAHVEQQARAIAAGKQLPNPDKELAAEQRHLAAREARRVRMEYLHRAAEQVRTASEDRLAADIRQLWTTVGAESTARRAAVATKLAEVSALMEEEVATERAALGQVHAVRQVLARRPLGPAEQITPGEQLVGTWKDSRSTVVLGRAPDVRRPLDSPARRTIRAFIEDQRIGVVPTGTRKLWQLLSPERLGEAIRWLQREGW